MTEETKAVIDAWVNQGRAPLYHRRMQAKLRKQWPVLARAIEALVKATQQKRES